MSDYVMEMFARCLAVRTRVEGMVAVNMQREAVGSSMAYDEEAFEECAVEIEGYANLIHEART